MTDSASQLPILVDMNRSGRSSGGTVYVYLTISATTISLARQNLQLYDGMVLSCYSDDGDGFGNRDDLVFRGEVHYSEARGWYAQVSWDEIKHLSEIAGDPGHWANAVDWAAVRQTESSWF